MWVKICGIRDVETTLRVMEAGADAIGLNFFEKTPRFVGREIAAAIVREVADAVEVVGLFVNHGLNEVIDTVETCSIDMVQIHGDESPDFLAELQTRRPELKLLRAFRVDSSGCGEMNEYLDECRRLDVCLAGCVVDSRVEGQYGGTGHTAPWDLLADQYDSARQPRLIVAGGLTPSNVAEAIRVTLPFGVDVAGGVESEKAVKDLELVRQFIKAARQ